MTASSIPLHLHWECGMAACHGPLPLHTVIYLITPAQALKGSLQDSVVETNKKVKRWQHLEKSGLCYSIIVTFCSAVLQV